MITLTKTLFTVSTALALVAGAAWAGQHTKPSAYSTADYDVRTAGDLYDICSVNQSHADHFEAQSFCYGFFAGGKAYHDVIAAAADFQPIVCAPPGVTRSDAVATFITYVDTNPAARQAPPIDTVMRAVSARWPCAQ